MFGFQGGESADTVARKKGYMQGRPAAMEFYDQLRPIDDQERGSAQLHGQGALWHLGGTGQERRSGLDARQAVLTRLWEASATETYTAATL